LRQKFASTFELGLLGSSSSSSNGGGPEVLIRVHNRPARSCLRGARKELANDPARTQPQRNCGPLRFGATATVYFFNNEEQVGLLVDSRSDLVVGRRLRLQSEPYLSAVAAAAALDAAAAAPSAAASPDSSAAAGAATTATAGAGGAESTSGVLPRKVMPRRVAVDVRSPPPPIFLTQPLPLLPSVLAESDDTAATNGLPLPSPADVKVSTPRPASVPTSDDDDADDDGSDSPPPIAIVKKSNAVDIAGGSRSPRAHAAVVDLAASAPSRFADTKDWLATTPTGSTPSSVGLAKHREDGLSPRPAATQSVISPRALKVQAVQSEIDAVLAVVDEHEARRQQKELK
jgi:hypothetical protein